MTEPTLTRSTLAQDAVILSPYFQDPVGHLVVLCSTNGDLTIYKYCFQNPGITEPTLMSSTLAQDDVILSPYFQEPAGHLVVLCSTNFDLTISKECVQCPGITEPTLMRSTLAKDDVILSPYFKDSHELQIGPGCYHTFPHPSRTLLVNS